MAPLVAVRVRNEGDVPFRDGWDGQTYAIEPGKDAIVPYEAVINWLGDPAAVDYGPDRRDRLNEVTRLRVRYGAYENNGLWDQNKPRLAAFHLDSNESITTVVDDPEGLNVTPSVKTELENRALVDQVAQMAQQLQSMQELLARQSAEGVSSPASTPGGELSGIESGAVDPSSESPEPAQPFGAPREGDTAGDPTSTISHSTSDKVKGEAGDQSSSFKAPEDTPSRIPTSQQNKR